MSEQSDGRLLAPTSSLSTNAGGGVGGASGVDAMTELTLFTGVCGRGMSCGLLGLSTGDRFKG